MTTNPNTLSPLDEQSVAEPVGLLPPEAPPDPGLPEEQAAPGLSDILRNVIPGAVTGASPEYEQIRREPTMTGRLAASVPISARNTVDFGAMMLEFTTAGDLKDMVSGILGREVTSGVDLEPWMRGLALMPFIGFGFGLKRSLHQLSAVEQAQYTMAGLRRSDPLLAPVFGQTEGLGNIPHPGTAAGGRTVVQGELPDIPRSGRDVGLPEQVPGLRQSTLLFENIWAANTFDEVGVAASKPSLIAAKTGDAAASPSRAAILETIGNDLITSTDHGEFVGVHIDGDSAALTAVKFEISKFATTIEGESFTGDGASRLYELFDEFADGRMIPGSESALEFHDSVMGFAKATRFSGYLDPEMALSPYMRWQALDVNDAGEHSLVMFRRTTPYKGKIKSEDSGKMNQRGLKKKGTRLPARRLIMNIFGSTKSKGQTVRYIDGPEADYHLAHGQSISELQNHGAIGDQATFPGLGKADPSDAKVKPYEPFTVQVVKNNRTPTGTSLRLVDGDKRTKAMLLSAMPVRRGDNFIATEGMTPPDPQAWAALEPAITGQLLRNVKLAMWWEAASDVQKESWRTSYAYYRRIIQEVADDADRTLGNTSGAFANYSNQANLEIDTIPATINRYSGRSTPIQTPDGTKLPREWDDQAHSFKPKVVQEGEAYFNQPDQIGTMPNEQFWSEHAETLNEWAKTASKNDKYVIDSPHARLDTQEQIVFKMSKNHVLELMGGEKLQGEKLRNFAMNSLSRGKEAGTGKVINPDLLEIEDALATGTMDTHQYWLSLGFRTPGDIPQFSSRAAYTVLNNAHANVARLMPQLFNNVHEVQSLNWSWWREAGGADTGFMTDDSLLRIFQGRTDDAHWWGFMDTVTEDGIAAFDPGKLDKKAMREGILLSVDTQGRGTVAAPLDKADSLPGLYPMRGKTMNVEGETWHLWAPIRMRRVKSITTEAASIIEHAKRAGSTNRLTGYSIHQGYTGHGLAHMHGRRRIKLSIPTFLAGEMIPKFQAILNDLGIKAEFATPPVHQGVSTFYEVPSAKGIRRSAEEVTLLRELNGEPVDPTMLDEAINFLTGDKVSSEWHPDVEALAADIYHGVSKSEIEPLWKLPKTDFQRTVFNVGEDIEMKQSLWLLPQKSKDWDRIWELLHQPLAEHADVADIDMGTFIPKNRQWEVVNGKIPDDDMPRVPASDQALTPDAIGWRVKDMFGEQLLDVVGYLGDGDDVMHTNQWMAGSGLNRELTPRFEYWADDGSGVAMSHLVEFGDEFDPNMERVVIAQDLDFYVEGASNQYLSDARPKGEVSGTEVTWGNEFTVPPEATRFAEDIYGQDGARQVSLDLEGSNHALDVVIKYRAIDAADDAAWSTRKPTSVAIAIPENPLNGGALEPGVARIAYDQDDVAEFFTNQGIPENRIVVIDLKRPGGRLRSAHMTSENPAAMEIARIALERTGTPKSLKWTYDTPEVTVDGI